jgi:hypothetical protein
MNLWTPRPQSKRGLGRWPSEGYWRSLAIPRREKRTLLFRGFFEIISSLLPEHAFVGYPEARAKLDPNKIYVENVRSLFRISERSAERYCETAVRQGVFSKFVELRCADGAIVATSKFDQELPKSVRCWTEHDGGYPERWIPTGDLLMTVFYRLNDEASARPIARTDQSLRSHSA